MATWAHGDPDAVVRGILASPAYRDAATEVTKAPKKSWSDLLWTWIVDHVVAFLRAIFGPIGRSLHATQSFWAVVSVLVVVVAVLALVYAIYRLIVAFMRPPAGDSARSRVGSIALAQPRTTRDWRDAARAAAENREYGRAIAALFNAALATLDERSLVAFDAARTPGEYARLVRRVRAPAAEPFNDLSGRFVRAAYAEEPVDADDYAASERAYARFEPAAREAP